MSSPCIWGFGIWRSHQIFDWPLYPPITQQPMKIKTSEKPSFPWIQIALFTKKSSFWQNYLVEFLMHDSFIPKLIFPHPLKFIPFGAKLLAYFAPINDLFGAGQSTGLSNLKIIGSFTDAVQVAKPLPHHHYSLSFIHNGGLLVASPPSLAFSALQCFYFDLLPEKE